MIGDNLLVYKNQELNGKDFVMDLYHAGVYTTHYI